MKIDYTRRALLCLLSATLLTSTTATVFADEDSITFMDPNSLEAELSSVSKLKQSDIKKIMDRMYLSKVNITESLMSQFSDPGATAATKFNAAYFLGELGLSEAVPLLIQNIELKDTTSDTFSFGFALWGEYPIQDALAAIGAGAIPAIVNDLASMDNNPRQPALLEVLSQILIGTECVVPFLTKQADAQTDSQRKARLLLAAANVTQ